MNHGLLNDIAICIMVAWGLAFVAQLFKQPLILAYIVAGFALGPVGFGLVREQASIETISGLGLIFLLFMIGLEIDLKKMLSAGRIILITAAVQILGGCALGVGFFHYVMGAPLRAGALDALYLAVATALSSTVIIIKILYDRRELESFSGRVTVGILVLQDLFAILFLALQGDLKNPSPLLLFTSLGKVGVLVAVALVVSKFVLPLLFRAVARLPELVLVGALAWCFLVGGLASALGLSAEMGALIAGVAISTFPYTLDVAAKVTSLRDFFVTLFFVALGMSIPAPTQQYLLWAGAVAGFVVATRFLTVFVPLYVQRQGHRASLLPAINLSQISELSLVILTLGIGLKHISRETAGIVAYAFVILAVLSTYAMMRADPVLRRMSGWLGRVGLPDLNEQTAFVLKPREGGRIFMLGFSWTASSLLEELTLRQPGILEELAIIDFNPVVHKELRRRGLNAIYGDIGQRDTLIHAGVGEAKVVLCTLSNTVLKGVTNLRLLQIVREINPHAQVIVHAELFEDVPKLYAAGASYVSVSRLVEAFDLCEVVEGARRGLLHQKAADMQKELSNRREVIP